MPRDISGNYTLPAGINPVVTNTLIDVNWANPTLADIATQLNNVFTRDGLLGPLAPVKFVDGTTALPGIAFNAATGTGFSRSATKLSFSWAGTEKMSFNGSAVVLGAAATDTLNVANGDIIKDASSRTGFGRTPTAEKVEVAGTVKTVGDGKGIALENTANNGGGSLLALAGANAGARLSASNGPLYLYAGGNDRATISITGILSVGNMINASGGFSDQTTSILKFLGSFASNTDLDTFIAVPTPSGIPCGLMLIGGPHNPSGVSWARLLLVTLRTSGGAAPDVAYTQIATVGEANPTVALYVSGGTLKVDVTNNASGQAYAYWLGIF